MKRYLFFAIFFIFLMSTAFSQSSEVALHLFGTASLPNGDFGKDIGDDAKPTRRSGFNIGTKVGLAQPGVGAGVELISPVGFKGLQWIFSSKALMNTVNTSTIQDEFNSMLGDSLNIVFDYGQWLNFPVMTGFRYDHHFSHKYMIYTSIQAGINFSHQASRKATMGTITVEEKKFAFARDFGFEAGFGILLNQTFNIGFRYLHLGTPRFAGEIKLSEKIFPEIFSRDGEFLSDERTISMFFVTLGIQLYK